MCQKVYGTAIKKVNENNIGQWGQESALKNKILSFFFFFT